MTGVFETFPYLGQIKKIFYFETSFVWNYTCTLIAMARNHKMQNSIKVDLGGKNCHQKFRSESSHSLLGKVEIVAFETKSQAELIKVIPSANSTFEPLVVRNKEE